VNIQRLFGSQRALKTVEDFTEFEQRAAYFDGDPVIATKKGVNMLERGSQVHDMGEFQEILDFPPAPKLDVLGKLDIATPEDDDDKGFDRLRAQARDLGADEIRDIEFDHGAEGGQSHLKGVAVRHRSM